MSEQNMAILIADLSGYTALTEQHGPDTAADLIDGFLEMVQHSLVGGSKLHERRGDEVMIVSENAVDILCTTTTLLQHAYHRPLFLQLHGAMHFGKVLIRNNSFFGTTINLTARIAAIAGTGHFWCSQDFLETLPDEMTTLFESKGRHQFKNLSTSSDLFELRSEQKDRYFIDPVCRMLVKEAQSSFPHPQDEDILFCSPGCRDKFMEERKVEELKS